MAKRIRFLALIISIVSLFMLSNCDAVDAIKGTDEPDDLQKIQTLHPVLLNGKWGYITNNGEMSVAPQFDEAKDFKGGFAAVRKDTEWGYISETDGSLTIPIQFSVAGDFSNGLALAQLPNQLYGFIDSTGNFAIEAQFELPAL